MSRRSIVLPWLACASLLAPGAAAAGAGKARLDPGRILCIPARDAAGKPLERRICRTAAQWRAVLRDGAPASVRPVEPFISPNFYYGAH
jgi:hypothetical protein